MCMPINVASGGDVKIKQKTNAAAVIIQLACDGDIATTNPKLRELVTLERMAKLGEESEKFEVEII